MTPTDSKPHSKPHSKPPVRDGRKLVLRKIPNHAALPLVRPPPGREPSVVAPLPKAAALAAREAIAPLVASVVAADEPVALADDSVVLVDDVMPSVHGAVTPVDESVAPVAASLPIITSTASSGLLSRLARRLQRETWLAIRGGPVVVIGAAAVAGLFLSAGAALLVRGQLREPPMVEAAPTTPVTAPATVPPAAAAAWSIAEPTGLPGPDPLDAPAVSPESLPPVAPIDRAGHRLRVQNQRTPASVAAQSREGWVPSVRPVESAAMTVTPGAQNLAQ